MYNIQGGPDRGPNDHQNLDQKQEVTDYRQRLRSTTKNIPYEDSMEYESATSQYTSSGSQSYWQTEEEPKADAPSSYTRAAQPIQSRLPSSANENTCSVCGKTFKWRSEQDRHFSNVHNKNGERPWECKVMGCPADVLTWVAESGLKRHNKMWHGPHTCEIMSCPRGAPNGFGSERELLQHNSDEHSMRMNSASQYTADPAVSALTDAVANTKMQSGQEINIETARPRVITGLYNSEDFAPNYKAHPAWEFKFGKVFKVLWSEPSAAPDQGGSMISERLGRFGAKFSEKVRRFVIIDPRKGHCLCLPIMTYSGQGCLKKGVHAEDHAIIYTTSRPLQFRGEIGITKKPIKVKPYSVQHKLDPASRLNYAKVYTVEHNVKVWFIGEIDRDSEWWLTAAYNEAHPPLKPRGVPPGSSGESFTACPPSSSSTSSYQFQNAQSASMGTHAGELESNSTGTSVYTSWPQIVTSNLNSYSQPMASWSWRPPQTTLDYYVQSGPMHPSDAQSSQYSPSGRMELFSARDYQASHDPQRQPSHRRYDDEDLYGT